jgi:hypothetical protein
VLDTPGTSPGRGLCLEPHGLPVPWAKINKPRFRRWGATGSNPEPTDQRGTLRRTERSACTNVSPDAREALVAQQCR